MRSVLYFRNSYLYFVFQELVHTFQIGICSAFMIVKSVYYDRNIPIGIVSLGTTIVERVHLRLQIFGLWDDYEQ